MDFIGLIDDRGKKNFDRDIKTISPTIRAETHGNPPKALLRVAVKEATKKGYSVARGGGIPSTSPSQTAKQEGGESG